MSFGAGWTATNNWQAITASSAICRPMRNTPMHTRTRIRDKVAAIRSTDWDENAGYSQNEIARSRARARARRYRRCKNLFLCAVQRRFGQFRADEQ
jgi:hypothetical protein